jgi:IS1 family transposase
MTDHWKAYAEFLPEKTHTQSKAECILLKDITAY